MTDSVASMREAMCTFSAARNSASSVSQSRLRRYVRAAYAASNVAIMAAAARVLAGRRRGPCASPPASALSGFDNRIWPNDFAAGV